MVNIYRLSASVLILLLLAAVQPAMAQSSAILKVQVRVLDHCTITTPRRAHHPLLHRCSRDIPSRIARERRAWKSLHPHHGKFSHALDRKITKRMATTRGKLGKKDSEVVLITITY